MFNSLCFLICLVLLGIECDPFSSLLSMNKHFSSNFLNIFSEWNKELSKKKPSLSQAISRLYLKKFLINFALCILIVSDIFLCCRFKMTMQNFKLNRISNLIKEISSVVSPLFLTSLLKYFNGEADLTITTVYGLLIVLSMLFDTLVVNQDIFYTGRWSMQLGLSICGLVYKKVKYFNFN
jgi:hypothetical protein